MSNIPTFNINRRDIAKFAPDQRSIRAFEEIYRFIKIQQDGGGGGGLTPISHRALDQLVHNISETSFVEYIRLDNFVTNITIWTDNSKTIKIRETIYTYFNGRPTTIVTNQYDDLGGILETLSSALTYIGDNISTEDVILT